MKRYTQKELKKLVNNGQAIDVTTAPGERRDIIPENYERIGTAHGANGLTGLLLKGDSGQLYAVTARTTNIFLLF